MSSRLFQNIREKQGLVYSIFSELNPFRDSGWLSVYAGTSRESAPKVVQSGRERVPQVQARAWSPRKSCSGPRTS